MKYNERITQVKITAKLRAAMRNNVSDVLQNYEISSEKVV